MCKAKYTSRDQGNLSTEHPGQAAWPGGTQGSGSECQLSHLPNNISLSQDETCSKHLIPFGRSDTRRDPLPHSSLYKHMLTPLHCSDIKKRVQMPWTGSWQSPQTWGRMTHTAAWDTCPTPPSGQNSCISPLSLTGLP